MVVSELFQATKRLKDNLEWLQEAKFFDKVDSTQKRINQFLPKNPEGAVLVIAETQSKGVGRQDRPWYSPPGGIWFTLALPMKDKPLKKVIAFSVLAGLIVAESLKEVNNLEAQIKWPNDVIYEGKKLGGTLSTTTKKFRKEWFLVGVGINVNNDLSDDLKGIATTIKNVRGQAQGRSRLIESVVDGLWAAWNEFDRTGFGPYQNRYMAKLSGIGKTATIVAGDTKIEGEMTGIDPNGAILIKSNDQTKSVQAGEVVGLPA